MNRALASLSYLPFAFVILLFLPKDRFVIFHLRQGFVLSNLWVVWLIVWRFVPVIGWSVLAPIGLVFLVYLTLFGVSRALSGKVEPLPFVGTWADKLRL